MGFKLPQRTARLVFDEDYKGLEVTVRLNISFGTYFHFEDILAANNIKDMLTEFGQKILVAWNVETEKGEPIPATPEGMLEIDPSIAGRIVAEWKTAMVNPPAPFVPPSNDGGMSAVQLVKTVTG